MSAGRLRLRAGLVLDAEHVLGAAEVLVENGRITAVQPSGGAAHADERVLGGDDMVLLPGLVNAHTHLAMSLLRGLGADLPLKDWLEGHIFPVEARMTAEDVRLGTMVGVAEALLSGTTAVVDMYFHADQVAEACLESGIRASLAVGLAGEGEVFERRLKEACDLLTTWRRRGAGRVEVRLGPHAPYTCPPASLGRVAEAASALQAGVHMHLSETRREVEEALHRYGRSPVALAAEAGLLEVPLQAAHVVWPEPGDAALLAGGGAVVGHCPASNLQLASGIAPAVALVDQGVTLALGTDGPASAPSLDMFECMRLAWLVGKGRAENASRPTAREVFGWATLGGARALGRTDVGRIAPGQRADLVLARADRPGLWPAPPDPYALVVQGLRADDVDTVLVDGEVLVAGGALVRLDVEALGHRAKARAAGLRSGAGPA